MNKEERKQLADIYLTLVNQHKEATDHCANLRKAVEMLDQKLSELSGLYEAVEDKYNNIPEELQDVTPAAKRLGEEVDVLCNIEEMYQSDGVDYVDEIEEYLSSINEYLPEFEALAKDEIEAQRKEIGEAVERSRELMLRAKRAKIRIRTLELEEYTGLEYVLKKEEIELLECELAVEIQKQKVAEAQLALIKEKLEEQLKEAEKRKKKKRKTDDVDDDDLDKAIEQARKIGNLLGAGK